MVTKTDFHQPRVEPRISRSEIEHSTDWATSSSGNDTYRQPLVQLRYQWRCQVRSGGGLTKLFSGKESPVRRESLLGCRWFLASRAAYADQELYGAHLENHLIKGRLIFWIAVMKNTWIATETLHYIYIHLHVGWCTHSKVWWIILSTPGSVKLTTQVKITVKRSFECSHLLSG